MKIGIDIGGSHIAVGLINKENLITSKKEHNWTEEEKEKFFESVEKACKNLIKDINSENDAIIEKIGIGYPSANIINGVINKNGIKLNLPKILLEEFKVPIFLKNDVKCSAICEKNIGSLKNYDNCFFMTLGTGIGGAYFYQNNLVTPNLFQGFEIGHMIIQKDGKQCKCGQKGCFEEYASMRVFRKEIEKLFNIQKLNSFKMFEIIQSGEKTEEVNEIINNYVENLSIGICNIINIFEPDAICIGGSFTYYAPIFMEKLKKKVKDNYTNRKIPEILLAKFENDAGIIGASMIESN